MSYGGYPNQRQSVVVGVNALTRFGAPAELRYLEEMTMDEVAQGLGSSISTAKRLVNRAVANVSKQVGKDADLRGYFWEGGSKVFDGS